MFRYYAYDFAGLLGKGGGSKPAAAGLLPHTHRPPATITLLTREVRSSAVSIITTLWSRPFADLLMQARLGRGFSNTDDLVGLLRGYGLPVRIISDLGRLSFKEQARRR